MKIKCRECDICGAQMDGRDCQFWLRLPRVKWGAPIAGMRHMDICDECFAKMQVLIQHPELIKKWGHERESVED